MRSIPILVLLFLTLAGSVIASDGVLEINQACAVQTGFFAGDTAGLPVTINASGSYRLTSNLVVPNQNTDGILVGSDEVGIDLNNFTIQGPVVCSGTPLACEPNTGTGTGVKRTSSDQSGVSVRNGSVRGMGSSGVHLGPQSEVTNVRVRSNRSAGILLGPGSTVSGNTSFANEGDGISASDGSSIRGNTVRSNTGFGLSLGTQTGYRENVISLNTAGTVNSGMSAGSNLCDGEPSCPRAQGGNILDHPAES